MRRAAASPRARLGLLCGALLAVGALPARADEDRPPSPSEDSPPAVQADDGAAAQEAGAGDGAAPVEEGAAEGAADGEAGTDAPAPDGAEATVPPATTGPSLGEAIEKMVANAHGSARVEYRLRSNDDDTDQDLYGWLDLRLGDENRDRLSATVYLRTALDLDGQRTGREGYALTSIQDKYSSPFDVNLYSLYVTSRPDGGAVEMARFGRQYVYAAETYHVDGVFAESAPIDDDLHLRATVYGGVPVHLYESSSQDDWIAGASLTAEPRRGSQATLDYTHVVDEFTGAARDDFAALRVWQRATEWLDLYGRASYLQGLRDAEGRATASFPDEDLLLQVSYFTLLKDRDEQFTTEMDTYYPVLHTLTEYDQYRLRAVKGFGENWVVEGGLDVRDANDDGTYNRDVTRLYLTPSVTDLLWDGSELTLVLDRWSGDGQSIDTIAGEVSHHFGKDLLVTAGTDFTMYGYDATRDREQNHVRTFYGEIRWDLTESLDLHCRYDHETDDEDTYDVFTLGLTLAF